jgi:two-component system, OmpR family, sensor histidine kinase KdpD
VQDRPAAREFGIAAAGLAALALVIWALRGVQELPNPAIAALLLLLVILITATAVRVRTAIAVSVVATAAFNFFLLPPFNTFALADAQNWVALFVFLAVAIIASQLSAAVRARAREAIARRDELARLFDLSRDVLVMSDSREAICLARSVARRCDLDYVAIALPTSNDWENFEAGAQAIQLDRAQLTDAFASAQLPHEFDAYARTYAGHRSLDVGNRPVRLVPLRVGAKPIGLLAASGRPIESGTLDALAGVVAIAIERAKMLEERKGAELTRQSGELKTALLASLGHDLRTPLTAIRVAASNIKAPSLTPDDRSEQSDLILGEAERLTRLFQNILDMARIDAGAIETESRWTHPSEIVAAARDHTQYALQQHRVEVAWRCREALSRVESPAVKPLGAERRALLSTRRFGSNWRRLGSPFTLNNLQRSVSPWTLSTRRQFAFCERHGRSF